MRKPGRTVRGKTPRRRVTLARVLSKYGIASRAEARRLILRGDVRVNGSTVTAPGKWVDPALDAVTFGGKPLPRIPRVYIAMHKPRGVVTTRADERGRGTVYDLLPEGLPWVFPVGRLDLDSTGLLLFTNDTMFGERVTGPAAKVPKTYSVLLERPLEGSGAAAMRDGLVLAGGVRCRPADVTVDPNDARFCRVVITEGKNRQVRRMFETLGNPVVRLHRLAIGSVGLGHLKEGQVRELTREEIAAFSGDVKGGGKHG
jgi:pseudouridine synthase